jgi:hypothetical protein
MEMATGKLAIQLVFRVRERPYLLIRILIALVQLNLDLHQEALLSSISVVVQDMEQMDVYMLIMYLQDVRMKLLEKHVELMDIQLSRR